jgi:hypothetical protein|tara:strand:+ start:235 stop:360 length:126 start_codon:yes stop_codon:yes gene_type:complete
LILLEIGHGDQKGVVGVGASGLMLGVFGKEDLLSRVIIKKT